MARYLRSAMRRWKMRPVRSWALSTPVALTDWAVSLNRIKIVAASPEGSCLRMSLAMAKMAQ